MQPGHSGTAKGDGVSSALALCRPRGQRQGRIQLADGSQCVRAVREIGIFDGVHAGRRQDDTVPLVVHVVIQSQSYNPTPTTGEMSSSLFLFSPGDNQPCN